MAAITFPVLQSINNGVQMSFNSQLWAAESIYSRFSYDATSTGAAEIYPRLDMLFGLREWIGDRVVRGLTNTTFTITNRTFEETIAIRREDIEDDKYGLLTPVAEEMGLNAGRVPDLLISQLMKTGTTTPTYDGHNFFDPSHPSFDANGNTIAVPNYTAGASTGWYLLDNSRRLKSFIFQRRRPFVLTPRLALGDPAVFDKNEFTWGVDGRCNAGFGLWQLAYFSQAALTPANIIAAAVQMRSLRRPDGSPLGIGMKLLLVVPSAIAPLARTIQVAEFDPTQATSTLVVNQARGMFETLENPWLN